MLIEKNTTFQNPREGWIDWAKTLLIWMMVLGHAGLSSTSRDFVYAFHMPAFFIISGYLYKQHCGWKTLRTFAIPVFFFSLINLGYVVLRMTFKGEDIIISELLAKITPPYWRCNFGEYISLFRGVWFIVVLFFMRLMMGDIPLFAFVRKSAYWLIPLLVLYMTLEPVMREYTTQFHEYYLYKVIGCLPFMLFGVLLKTNKEHFMNVSNWGLVVLLIVYSVLVPINGTVEIWAYIFGRSYVLFYLCALVASIFLFNLCKKLTNNKIVETFSKGTFLILGLHSPILDILNKVYDLLSLPHLSVISSLIVLLLCYYPIKIALRYCPSLLGK